MLLTCHEKVLRLAAIDCSSPMSAKTELNTGRREPSAAGMCRPACAISASSPAVLSATVLPPVLGPVMTSTDVGGTSRRSTGTGACCRCWCASSSASSRGNRASTAGMSSGWRAASSSIRPSCDKLGRGGVAEPGEAGLGLHRVEAGRDVDGLLQFGAAAAEPIGQFEQDAMDFLGLLLEQGDDVVVDLDRAERLEEEARAARRAAVHDAGNRRALLGAHQQHVAPVAVGDDLLLQVLRRVTGAEVALERAAQPRALLPQAVANGAQRRARVVEDLAGGVDGAADVSDFALEGGGAADQREQTREAVSGLAADAVYALVHGFEEGGEAEQADGFEGVALLARAARVSSRSAGPRNGMPGASVSRRTASVVVASDSPTSRGSVRRNEGRQALIAQWREREATHDGDDAVELERLERRRDA